MVYRLKGLCGGHGDVALAPRECAASLGGCLGHVRKGDVTHCHPVPALDVDAADVSNVPPLQHALRQHPVDADFKALVHSTHFHQEVLPLLAGCRVKKKCVTHAVSEALSVEVAHGARQRPGEARGVAQQDVHVNQVVVRVATRHIAHEPPAAQLNLKVAPPLVYQGDLDARAVLKAVGKRDARVCGHARGGCHCGLHGDALLGWFP
mmetsp:Transcript_31706/g.73779  ORF Transcript_31706/g.73779 Transcript_31706/m.73779 type:complete len:207 (-) Transcript_31706:96-716(-)